MLNLFRKSQSEPPLNWQETPTGIQFTAPSDNLALIEYAANLPTDAYHAQAQWLLLKELLDNGQANRRTWGFTSHLRRCVVWIPLTRSCSVCQNRIRST